MIDLAGYVASGWILAMYAYLASTGRSGPFNWANAIGCIPIAIGEMAVGAGPALVLTSAFGAIGWLGVLRKAK